MRGGARLLVAGALLALLGAAGPGEALRCDRRPDGTGVGRTPADGRFTLKVSGGADTYVPGTVYSVSIQGQRSSQMPSKFAGFLLVAEAEPRDVVSESFASNQGPVEVGTFQTTGDTMTKYSDRCPNAVTHTNSMVKNEITALWTAPPVGSGCLTLKATVIEHHDIWYMDDGPLSKTLCENIQESYDMQPLIVNKCCACDEAKYEVTFEGLWSRHTHPKDFPDNSWLTRFSDVIGASHAADYRFWDYGQHASEGLRQLAEHGTTRVLESELKAESDHIRTIIKARGISYPNLTGKTFAVFRVDNRHHLMSLVSMINPSPDWVVGVSGLELCTSNCSWIESKVLNLYPWDVGTDSGPTYVSPDEPTTPPDVVRRIRPNFPNDPHSPFYDPSGADMKPLARLHLSRQRLYEKLCDGEGGNVVVSREEDSSSSVDACKVMHWGEWSACSATCGKGVQRRQRQYLYSSRAEGCRKHLTQKRPCTAPRRHCRQEEEPRLRVPSEDEPDPAQSEGPCALTAWSSWSGCSARCGRGSRTRSRKFRIKGAFKRCHQGHAARPDLHQTDDCLGQADDCAGLESEAGIYDDNPDCPTTPWSDWSDCTATCGKGRKMRTRQPYFKDVDQQQMLRSLTRMQRKRALWGRPPKSNQEDDEKSEEENEEDDSMHPEGDGDGDSDVSEACKNTAMMEEVECEGVLPSCDVSQEDARQICSLPKIVGPCRAYMERWFFDINAKKCEPFGYTGCQGNRNNFDSHHECWRVCSSYREDLKRIEKILEENSEDDETNFVHAPVANHTFLDVAQQDDNMDTYYGLDQFGGLDPGNQIGNRRPLAGDLSSGIVTGDGSLSGIDGPTNPPNSNEMEDSRENKKNKNRDRNNRNQRRDRNKQQGSDAPGRHRYGGRDQNEEKRRQYQRGDADEDEQEDSEEARVRESTDINMRKPAHSGTNGVIEEVVGLIKKCEVSKWTDWSGCNVTCGRGFETKSRYIIKHPLNGGKDCPRKLLKRRKCLKLRPCKGGGRRSEEDTSNGDDNNEDDNADEDNSYDSNPTWGPGNHFPSARKDCVLSGWSNWSPCSGTCGIGALRQRTRSVRRPPSGGGQPCGPRVDKQSCDLMPCSL